MITWWSALSASGASANRAPSRPALLPEGNDPNSGGRAAPLLVYKVIAVLTIVERAARSNSQIAAQRDLGGERMDPLACRRVRP